MQNRVFLLPIALLALALAACGDDGESVDQAVHWGYEGEIGPEHWADLSPDFATCGSGTSQSPIDIPATVIADQSGFFEADYIASVVHILNNGHTVQVNYDPGSILNFAGGAWELLQFHFHAGSEHTVGGRAFPLEVHLVHAGADGRLAVVGVLFEEGEDNPVLEALGDVLPEEEIGEETIEALEVDATDLLPLDLSTWRYAGSLTTPPCTEGVSWFVMGNVITASPEQIDRMADILHGNHRPAQDLNDRSINGA